MLTPCIRICKLDDDGRCVGCKRTTEELSKWFWMSDEERQVIMEQLKHR